MMQIAVWNSGGLFYHSHTFQNLCHQTHLFGPMKEGLHGKHIANGEAVIVAIKKWLVKADNFFYESRMQPLVQWSRKYIQTGGEYVEK
jgi:hypothetical protein